MQETRTVPASSELDVGNLTQFEYLALNSPLNIADAHARQGLTAGQARIIDDLPNLFLKAAELPVEEVEREAHRAYFGLLGQHSYPGDDGRVLACYSSSVAMEILARSLAGAMSSVALIHPTFDNIPDILRGVGLDLVPVAEERLGEDDLDDVLGSVGCVFVTTPNNPTGRVLSEEGLRRLAGQCAERDLVLALDTSFRGFDPAGHYDHYRVLRDSGCRWVVIEDTGKLWPTLDLKVGWLVTAANLGLPVAKIYSDILLGVSPMVLALVQRFSEDAADGGLADLHRFVAENRALVREGLAGVPGIHFPDPHSRASVERVNVGARSALDVWSSLRDHNVYVLPCQKFHWANPPEGNSTLRIALARSAAPLREATRALRSVLLSR
ncbi:enduracididine biosynthesis enzyme MppP [Streptosporangium sp. NPDC006013]|uniref:enduracididine biosynthesis enzyme MppP n=1 Tax=Streptosporangium sp. NPDC006013 TaxID=3155596 RepID=UPI0033BB61BF